MTKKKCFHWPDWSGSPLNSFRTRPCVLSKVILIQFQKKLRWVNLKHSQLHWYLIKVIPLSSPSVFHQPARIFGKITVFTFLYSDCPLPLCSLVLNTHLLLFYVWLSTITSQITNPYCNSCFLNTYFIVLNRCQNHVFLWQYSNTISHLVKSLSAPDVLLGNF